MKPLSMPEEIFLGLNGVSFASPVMTHQCGLYSYSHSRCTAEHAGSRGAEAGGDGVRLEAKFRLPVEVS